MLTIQSAAGHANCDQLDRRDFLRIGTLGLGGLGLSQLLSTAAAAGSGTNYLHDKSIVWLFLCGGPSQIETFDPHPDSPMPHRSVTGSLQTKLPGLHFGTSFPELAKRADRLAVVHSYQPHGISDHAMAIRHVFQAGNPVRLDASIGAVYSRIRGANHPQNGMPTFCELIEDEADYQFQQDADRMRSSDKAGKLGGAYNPFASGGESELNENLKLNLPLERLEDRRQLLRSLDRLSRGMDRSGAMESLDHYEQQAVNLILGQATRKALDLSLEDPKVVARYDTSRFQSGYNKQQASTIGRQLLTARRLCEAGAGFVTVGHSGWDHHGNGKHPGVHEGTNHLGIPLDKAVSAFLDDVQERGLSDKILLVITGEFGRTPRIAEQGGRGHWPGLCPLIFAGGGLNMGQVIGRSTRDAGSPASDPYDLSKLLGSIVHSLFKIGELRLDLSIPRDVARMVEGVEPIRELFA